MRPTFHEKLVVSGHDFILSADGKTSKVAPDPCADFVFNDIPKNVALMLADRLGPESNTAQQQAVVLNDKFNNIPKAYVRCELDQVIDVRLQDKMVAETYCSKVYTLKTGHCPFESDPRSLADILLDLT
ncbi:MAG: hypothetical protein Q8876_09670 [Bacillota bacterium]|nr:hypothetical protein [Bacillota bacterium]